MAIKSVTILLSTLAVCGARGRTTPAMQPSVGSVTNGSPQTCSGTPIGTPWDKYSPKKLSHLRKINNQSVMIKRQLGRESPARANSAGTYTVL